MKNQVPPPATTISAYSRNARFLHPTAHVTDGIAASGEGRLGEEYATTAGGTRSHPMHFVNLTVDLQRVGKGKKLMMASIPVLF